MTRTSSDEGARLVRSLHSLSAGGSPGLRTVATADGVNRFVSEASAAPFGWQPASRAGTA